MKTVSIFLALINSLMAGVILLASLTGNEIHEVAFLWLLTKILAALVIIVISILTWLGNMFTLKPSWLTLGSLVLVALGAATIVWTFHLAMISGDMEYYMAFYGASLMMQGAASLFGFAGESRNITASQVNNF